MWKGEPRLDLVSTRPPTDGAVTSAVYVFAATNPQRPKTIRRHAPRNATADAPERPGFVIHLSYIQRIYMAYLSCISLPSQQRRHPNGSGDRIIGRYETHCAFPLENPIVGFIMNFG